MGFQFNHVGGGTKTRRPITINMKYNAQCTEPVCYLARDDCLWEEELPLSDLRVRARPRLTRPQTLNKRRDFNVCAPPLLTIWICVRPRDVSAAWLLSCAPAKALLHLQLPRVRSDVAADAGANEPRAKPLFQVPRALPAYCTARSRIQLGIGREA